MAKTLLLLTVVVVACVAGVFVNRRLLPSGETPLPQDQRALVSEVQSPSAGLIGSAPCGTDCVVSKSTAVPKPPPAKGQGPLVCKQTNWTPVQQKHYGEIRQRLHDAAQEIRELPDGYAFRLPPEASLCRDAAEFIMLEHQCCPFFHFAIELESGEGPLWLRLSGGAGVKEFLKVQLEAQTSPAKLKR